MKHYYSQETDALDLLMKRGLPEKVVLHCKAVADTCGAMVKLLNGRGFHLDEQLCIRAGLLHDIERTKPNHEEAGAQLLSSLGMLREADIVRHHMGYQIDYTAITERELVFLADKVTEEHHRVTVAQRYQRALRMTEDKPEVHRHIESITQQCIAMEALYEQAMGKSFGQIPIGMEEERFLWNDESIGWMAAAEQYSGYYAALAEKIAALLPPDARVAEPGPGAGFLTRELAKYCAHVTAVEIDERAVREIDGLALANVTALCADAEYYAPAQSLDAAIYCFYGGEREIMSAIKSGKYKTVLAIGQAVQHHNFSDSKRRRCFQSFVELLDREKVAYQYSTIRLDFSQPLKNMEDARRFASHYGGERTPEQVLEKLQPGRGDYAYLLPAVRNIGIAKINCSEV